MGAVWTLIDKRKNVLCFLPGIAVAFVIAVIAVLLRGVPAFATLSPLMIAILIGIVVGNLCRLPPSVRTGLGFSSRRLLRFAIGLLGLQLSISQIAAVGLDGIGIVTLSVTVTFVGVCWMGKLLGIDSRLSGLLAAGTSICGASAIAAMSAVNQATEEDVTYAMGAVTVLGTLLMFLLPAAALWFGLDARSFGLWAGASIHEVAQVTGAAFQYGDAAGEIGVIVKLMRVLMLAPLILICGLWLRHKTMSLEGASSPGFPVFVLGFIAAVILNSVVPIPSDTRAVLMLVTTFLMSISLAALGVQTDVKKLRAKGVRPLALGISGAVLIVVVTLGLIFAAQSLS